MSIVFDRLACDRRKGPDRHSAVAALFKRYLSLGSSGRIVLAGVSCKKKKSSARDCMPDNLAGFFREALENPEGELADFARSLLSDPRNPRLLTNNVRLPRRGS